MRMRALESSDATADPNRGVKSGNLSLMTIWRTYSVQLEIEIADDIDAEVTLAEVKQKIADAASGTAGVTIMGFN